MRVIDTDATIKNLKTRIDKKYKHRMDFAEEVGVSDATVTFWLNGRNLPNIDNLVRISEILGCSINSLIITKEI